MIRLMYLTAALMLFSGCGIFKTKTATTTTHLRSISEIDSKKEKHLLMVSDSLREDFLVEIAPVGNFSYSLTEGFKGSGSSIKIRGKKTSALKVLETTSLASDHQRFEKEKADKNTIDKQVKREGFKFNHWFLLLLILAALLWLWKSYKKRTIT